LTHRSDHRPRRAQHRACPILSSSLIVFHRP
jgi:hypothetical protein